MGPAAAQLADDLFERYEVVTGSAKRQTVLTGFLLGSAIADLAVVNIEERGDRRLRIYAFGHGTWAPTVDVTLGPEVSFVDVANIGGRDRLITYDRGRLNWFDPDSATQHALVATDTNFNPPRRGEIPHVDITRDVNDDGLDDLVVPGFDGFRVFVQMSDSAFAAAVKIGPTFEMANVYEPHGYRYDPWDQGRIHEMDYNHDGRSDLVFWNEDHFEAPLQDARGLFGTAPRTFATAVAFDSDDLASLDAPYRARRSSTNHDPSGEMTTRVLHTLADLNGDGIADLGILHLEGGTLWKMHSNYEVHLGALAPNGGTLFASEVSTVAPSDGIPLRVLGKRHRQGVRQYDPDHDGHAVLMFTTMDMGGFGAIGKVVDALFTRSVSLDLEFFRMEGGLYPDQPNAARKTRIYARDKSGKKVSFLPPVLIGDVNGDGRPDLLVGRGRNELRVFLGVPGPELFTRRPQKVAVAMASEEYTWLVDLNKDGKQDILMHHPSNSEPHRLTMLIAQ